MITRKTRADEDALCRCLTTPDVPVLTMVRNHDGRTLLRNTLPLSDSCMRIKRVLARVPVKKFRSN